MRKLALLVTLALATPAMASQEQTHVWKSATVAASTQLLGDVAIKATADASGNVKTLDIVVKGKTIVVPAKLLASLPALPLASLEIRTERGYDKDPWLYAFFRSGAKDAKGSVEVHVAVQAGKLMDASVDTSDGAGGSKHVTVSAASK
jgi:predicted secreted protein